MFINKKNQLHQNTLGLLTHFGIRTQKSQLCNPKCSSHIYFSPFNNMHITTLACGFWSLERTDTQSPHLWPGSLSVVQITVSKWLHVAERLKAQPALLTHLLLPLTATPGCNVIPLFWAHYYNPHSKMLLRRILKPSTDKKDSSIKPPSQHFEIQASNSWSSDTSNYNKVEKTVYIFM